jgi:hypothetical protein
MQSGYELPPTQSLILKAWPSPELCRALQQAAAHTAAMGKNVLVLDDSRPAITPEFGEVGSLFLRDVFQNRTDFTQGNGYACSLWRFSELLRQNDATEWVKRIGLVIVPNGEQAFENPFEWELMAMRLYDRMDGKRPPFHVVIPDRRLVESSLRRILPVFGRESEERTLPHAGPGHAWWTIWTTRQGAEYAQPLEQHGDQYCGIEPVLANFAGQKGISQSLLERHPEVATTDHREALQSELGTLHIGQETDGGWMDSLPGTRFVGAATHRDQCGNPWRLLQSSLAAGRQDVLLNIVTHHGLLTDYQIANAAFFAHQPLEPISPMVVDRNAHGSLILLLLRMEGNNAFGLDALANALNAGGLHDHPDLPLKDLKKSLVRHGMEHLSDSISVSTEWAPRITDQGVEFQRTAYIGFGGHDLNIDELDWLREFRVRDHAGTVYSRLRKDHVGQRYQPGKTCVFDEKTFRVDRIDWDAGEVFVTHDDTLPEFDYRDIRQLELMEAPGEHSALDTAKAETDGLIITAELHQLHFRVYPDGHFKSRDHWATPPFRKTSESPWRDYRYGRIARLHFATQQGNLLSAGSAVALAQWLNEAARTLMPESWRYFLAVADIEDETYPDASPLSHIFPRLVGTQHRRYDHSILVVEDSHADLGVPRAFLHQWEYLLDICSDHLTWLLEEATPEARVGQAMTVENTNLLMPAVNFLTYGYETADSKIDLAGLKDALSKIPTLQTTSNFTQRRRRALADETRMLIDQHATDDEQACDFCGIHIDGPEHETFPDGRVRCPACSDFGIDLADQLPPLYQAARAYFKQTLGVEFAENIDIKLASPQELAGWTDSVFIPTSGFDARTLGVAKNRSHTGSILGEARHTVLVESGFSPEETASTLVHELTHVWQYNMLDHEKMHAEYGALLFEGHAMWAEKDFLSRGARASRIPDCDQERLARAASIVENMIASDSEYGRGYRLLMSLMEEDGAAGENPIEWLLKHYSSQS